MKIRPGRPFPLGATWDGLGVNFAVYSEHADAVQLLLFERSEDSEPAQAVFLSEKSGPVWHGYIPGITPGQLYGYRIYGPYAPEAGNRYDPFKVVLDPYAKALGRPLRWDDSLFTRAEAQNGGWSLDGQDSAAFAPLAAVAADNFTWGDDRPPRIPWAETIIYETHVKGLSKLHPNVDEAIRGTYLGACSDPIINHLIELGVTTVEFLPVQAFVNDKFLLDQGLSNYWGYNPLAYFAPEPSYAAGNGLDAVREFKMMVRRFHEAGLEVLIDVVYNHTGEGNQLGPTLSFRGLDNASYYKLSPDDPQFYMDYTGTGNTLNLGNPFVLQLVTESLRYWVEQMHVDGFRFDLAATLARELFDVDMLSAFFQVLQQDPVLSRVKLIAEPWDVGPGGYQVGNFPWYWGEWNGRYRDSVRKYWRGDNGLTPEFVTRISGSSDLYAGSGRKPYASINFITAHDGFTLEDLVSYESKHNEQNGEDNRDGTNENYSSNCGVEGPTDNYDTLQCREGMKRGLFASLMLSQGIPMILGGDELSRTQKGNNNAYCQDNEISWLSWELDERKQEFLAFCKQIIAFRKAHPSFRRKRFLSGQLAPGGCKDVTWHHPDSHEMSEADWHNANLKAFGMLLCGSALHETDTRGIPLHDDTLLVLFNSGRSVRFTMPVSPSGRGWERVGSTLPERGRPIFPPGRSLILRRDQVMVLRAIT